MMNNIGKHPSASFDLARQVIDIYKTSHSGKYSFHLPQLAFQENGVPVGERIRRGSRKIQSFCNFSYRQIEFA